MGLRGDGGIGRWARLAAVVAGGLALANCSGSLSSRIDPRYGVSASARVIEPGQPVPKGGGVYRVGKPYVVGGRVYVPETDPHYSATGLASWYGDDFHGRYTANGEIFDENAISAAHPTLPLPCYARVTDLANGRSIIVRVNDRGPYAKGRLIDLSVQTAKLLGFYGHGIAKVRVDFVGMAPLAGSDDRKLMATLREGAPAQAPVMVASAKPFVPTYFDRRPMTQVAPIPPDRPYRLGEADIAMDTSPEPAVAKAAPAARTVELAAASRTPAVTETPRYSPVSAYAPARDEGLRATGFMSGRGLY
ncbi:MAG TPA: septal ring lytic transglycosylase RlpA family protein [Pseudolabrys sp.]|jgi:rare lipoprotein A|nr:septal ring lytic transglycosylase RlpA family protein [Pseudolabrys sp.]